MLHPVSLVLSRILHRADNAFFKLTGGAHSIAEIVGLPIVQLRTIGAKSGKNLTLPIVGLSDDEKIALISTNFGRRRNPGWYYNLKANPRCEVIKGRQVCVYMAREVNGDEYDRYWRLALSYYAGYEKYKERAAPRRIPIMLLEPVK